MTETIRVLYVDDESDLLTIGKFFLEQLGGFTVTTAPGAAEAMVLLKEQSFDVIISDYHMPMIDGITFLKHMKTENDTTPFILFTGKGREEVVIEALNNGADFYLQKGGEPKAQFTEATGVASIITSPDGTPITRPSKFTRLCNDIIRKTELGCKNCYKSDALIGRPHPEGPIVQPCLSGGLWDAGASIVIGDRHIANWLIGQVRNDALNEEVIRSYAREIGVDESTILEAYREVPSMSSAKFQAIAQSLYTLANQLSRSAYQNVQQARFISAQIQAENELLRKKDELQAAYEQISASEEELRANLEELIQHEVTIRINEERLLMAQEISHTGCWEFNLETRTIWGSAEALRIYGFPLNVGDIPIDEIEACVEEREQVHQTFVDFLEGKTDYNKYITLNPVDGSPQKIVHSIARLEKNDGGNPSRVIGVIQDVTCSKYTESVLKEINEAFEQAQKAAHVGSWAYNFKTNGITWSDELYRVFG